MRRIKGERLTSRTECRNNQLFQFTENNIQVNQASPTFQGQVVDGFGHSVKR